VVLGAVASITGAALLVYANRPECRTNELASGCGYGTKVVGGAVLSGGLVSLVVGALTWRR
jgi:tetrahydromethanopterin S-methyltransferase subunit C